MATGNASPRQKMINMMYLVLTALLAINVAKEVLDAFVVINMGLLQQKENIEQKNETILAQLENQLTTDKNNEKLKRIVENARLLQIESEKLTSEIDEMKVELIQETDKVDKETALLAMNRPVLVNKKDDYDTPTNYFGTNEAPGDKGKANVLKQKIATYQKFCYKILDNILKDSDNKKTLKLELETKLALLNTNDPKEKNADGSTTWEMQYFYHLPLSAALTELTKWQNFVQGAEADMMSFMWNEVYRENFKFDKVCAAIIPKSSFVTSGSNFEADIFLAAYNSSSSNKPTIIYGSGVDTNSMNVLNGVTLDMNSITNGVGHISIPATGMGEKNIGGVIEMKDGNNKIQKFAFSTKYNVAPPSASIGAPDLNVLYYGLKNKITVSVPGFAPNQVVVNCSGGTLTGSNGNYEVSPNGMNGKTIITVSARGSDGKVINMGKQEYRNRALPIPDVMFGNVFSGGKVSKNLATASALIPDMSNYILNYPVLITSFNLTILSPNGVKPSLSSNSNRLTQHMVDAIKNSTAGTKLIFTDIKMNIPGRKVNKEAIFTLTN